MKNIRIGSIVEVSYLDHGVYREVELNNPKYYQDTFILTTHGELIAETKNYIMIASDYTNKVKERREGDIHLILKRCIVEIKKLEEVRRRASQKN